MKTPQRILLTLAGSALLAVSGVSCVGPYAGPNQSVGSVLGAGAGALAGAVIGNQSGRPLEGAAIGGAIGGLAGAAMGNAQDQMVYGPRQPVVYGGAPVVYNDYYYQPAPVIVQRRYVSTGWGYGGYGGWGGRSRWGGGWGGAYCAPPPCW